MTRARMRLGRMAEFGRGRRDTDDGLGVDDLALFDHPQQSRECVAFDCEYLVGLELLADLGQPGGEKDVHLFGQKAGRDVKFRELFDLFRRYADLFFQLSDAARERVFALVECARRDLKQIDAGRVAILLDERRRPIGKYRQDHRTPAMNDDLTLVHDIALADLVHANIENLSGVDRFGRKNFGFHNAKYTILFGLR